MLTVFILVSVTAAAIFDWRWRRIPNWLVLVTVAVSFTYHFVSGGLAGLGMSAAGLLAGTAVLFPLFAARGLGGGDVKFFGALGAAVTFKHVFVVLFIAAMIAGLMALFRALWDKVLIRTLAGTAALTGWFLRGRLKPHVLINLANKAVIALPFGVSMAAAAWLFVLFGKQ